MLLIATHQLTPNPITRRLYVVDTAFDRLVTSIHIFGVLEPLIVFPLSGGEGGYQVVSGNRRLTVAQQLGIQEVPCVVIPPVEITEALASAHQEQRVKQPSDIIRELRILEEEFGLRQGVRSNHPRIQEAKAYRKTLVDDHKKSTIDRLRQYDAQVRLLVGEDKEAYSKLMSELDNSQNISGSLNRVKRLVADKENGRIAGDLTIVKGGGYTIHRGSCEQMGHLEDGSVATIVTSPPYFQLREYDNGVAKADQLGQESSVEEFCQNLARVFDEAKRILKKDGSLFVNIADNVQSGRMLGVPQRLVIEMMNRGWILNDTIVWSKINPMFQDTKRTLPSHEYIFHFVKSVEFYYDKSWVGKQDFGPHELTHGGENKVVSIRSHLKFDGHVLTTTTPNNHDLREACAEEGLTLSHSATFPREIPLVAILLTSRPGDLVVDMFNGTGTTGEVAVSLGRNYVGYELSPTYMKFSEIRLTKVMGTQSIAA